MWERTLIESNRFDRSTKRWWTIPAAAVLHIAFMIVAILVGYWHVEAVEAPPIGFSYVIPAIIAPPPRLGGGATQTKRLAKTQPPVQGTQPVEVHPLAAESSFPVEQLGPEMQSGTEDAPPGEGDPNGVEGGLGSSPLNTDTIISLDEPPRVIVSGVTPPVLLKRVEPDYPRTAIIKREEGIVVLEAVITRNGDVEQVRTLRSDSALLENAAIHAVLQWKYKPALVQGRPVKVYFTVTVTFHIR